jgi:hypothetical protein
MTRPPIACVLLGALLLADTICGAALPPPLREVKPELRPLGTATLHWLGLHVYDIALFSQEAAYATSGSAVLTIRYNISIKSRRLQETTLKEWRRMGKGEEVQRQRWIKQVSTLWPDVKPGESLTAFKRQGGPTQFYLGDRLLGEVPDPAFGPAFFAIWLDAECSYPKLRDQLLEGKAEENEGR